MNKSKSLGTAIVLGSFLILELVFLGGCSSAPPAPAKEYTAIDPSIEAVPIAAQSLVQAKGHQWMISTQGKYATDEAARVLQHGGTIVDAAIVASLVIGVERPQSTGIGGGGFLIYHEAKTGKNFVFDFRERAPTKAKPKMFLNAEGEVVEGASDTGSLSIAVPGMIRGLTYLHSRFSHADWRALVGPAEKLAKSGFKIYPSLARAIDSEKAELAKYPESKSTFLHPDGSPMLLGETLVQKNLGESLGAIAAAPEEFYRGFIARKILRSVKKYGGILSESDLATYQVKERKALEANWKGYKIVSMPPPSSGGVHVIQILKMLENDPLETYGFLSPKSIHLEAQAMQQAFADRARYLGDPDFVKIPLAGLTEETYLKYLRSEFDENKARTADSVHAGAPPRDDEMNTSHLSIMDDAGNVIVSTQTINGWFGSHLIAEGTGIVLNNEMDDFSAKAGASNDYGATATTDANGVDSRKTPLSSMSPTILFDRAGKPVLALGAPGGTRIITAVAETILNYVVYHQDLYHAVSSPRIHEQWKPDVLSIENQSVPVATLTALGQMGWQIKRMPAQSNVMAVAREGDSLVGVADPRDIGTCRGE